jgi:hypothetical protein
MRSSADDTSASRVVRVKGTLPERMDPSPADTSSGAGSFVSLKGSEVFHLESCSALKRAKTKERTVYPTRAAATRERRPAKDCNP